MKDEASHTFYVQFTIDEADYNVTVIHCEHFDQHTVTTNKRLQSLLSQVSEELGSMVFPEFDKSQVN